MTLERFSTGVSGDPIWGLTPNWGTPCVDRFSCTKWEANKEGLFKAILLRLTEHGSLQLPNEQTNPASHRSAGPEKHEGPTFLSCIPFQPLTKLIRAHGCILEALRLDWKDKLDSGTPLSWSCFRIPAQNIEVDLGRGNSSTKCFLWLLVFTKPTACVCECVCVWTPQKVIMLIENICIKSIALIREPHAGPGFSGRSQKNRHSFSVSVSAHRWHNCFYSRQLQTFFVFKAHKALTSKALCLEGLWVSRRFCTNWPKIEIQQMRKNTIWNHTLDFQRLASKSCTGCVLGFNLAWTLRLNNTHRHNWRYRLACRGQGLEEQCQRKCSVSALTQTSRASATLGIMGRDRQAAALRVSRFSVDHTQASSIVSLFLYSSAGSITCKD